MNSGGTARVRGGGDVKRGEREVGGHGREKEKDDELSK